MKTSRYFIDLLQELRITTHGKPTIFCDNQSAIALTRNIHSASARTKHLRLRYHYVSSAVANDFTLRYIPTKQQPADLFTKPFELSSFKPMSDTLLTKADL